MKSVKELYDIFKEIDHNDLDLLCVFGCLELGGDIHLNDDDIFEVRLGDLKRFIDCDLVNNIHKLGILKWCGDCYLIRRDINRRECDF